MTCSALKATVRCSTQITLRTSWGRSSSSDLIRGEENNPGEPADEAQRFALWKDYAVRFENQKSQKNGVPTCLFSKATSSSPRANKQRLRIWERLRSTKDLEVRREQGNEFLLGRWANQSAESSAARGVSLCVRKRNFTGHYWHTGRSSPARRNHSGLGCFRNGDSRDFRNLCIGNDANQNQNVAGISAVRPHAKRRRSTA